MQLNLRNIKSLIQVTNSSLFGRVVGDCTIRDCLRTES